MWRRWNPTDAAPPGQCHTSSGDSSPAGGFLESEIELNRGAEEADRFAASSGRHGLGDWFIRLFQSVGLKKRRSRDERRMRTGPAGGSHGYAVLTPSEERKDLAVRLIRDCGGRFINFFGRLTVERMSRYASGRGVRARTALSLRRHFGRSWPAAVSSNIHMSSPCAG